MTLGKSWCKTIAALAVGALVSGSALAQVTTRLVTAAGVATSVKVIPTAAVSIDVRVDAPATTTIGDTFRLSQTAGPSANVISITGRSFAGSPYSDTTFSVPDPTVLLPANALLDPDSNVNLGSNTPGFTPTAAASNILAANLTLTVGAGAALGTYTVAPMVGNSFVTAPGPVNFAMTGSFDIIVGQTLSVTKLGGTGTGLVTSSVGAINCGATCSDIYPGTVVTLTAAANPGSTFTGWSGGGCSGTAPCAVTVNAATTVNAQFDLLPNFTLTITKTGNGTGTVTSNPVGINCGATCSFAFVSGTPVVLTAAAGPGQTFTGWSGVPAVACPGTGTCSVTISAAQTVTANFTDTIPPDTTITGNPTDPSSVPNPQFTFTSSEVGSTFQCSLDGAVFTACTSPWLVNVGNGVHTFAVRAIDPGGNVDPTPASFTWTVNLVAVTSVPVPTLNEWMLMLLALVLASAGVLARRRRE